MIVRGHGGSIWVENRPCGGARFTFTLPTLSSTVYRPERVERTAGDLTRSRSCGSVEPAQCEWRSCAGGVRLSLEFVWFPDESGKRCERELTLVGLACICERTDEWCAG